jgi:hypothetical protein
MLVLVPRSLPVLADQRQTQRKSVNIVLNKYIHGQPHLCCAVNLSRGGMLLRKVFEPNIRHETVVLEFQLPGSSRVLRTEGVILSTSAAARSVGVRFVRPSAEVSRLLERFLTAGTLADAGAQASG